MFFKQKLTCDCHSYNYVDQKCVFLVVKNDEHFLQFALQFNLNMNSVYNNMFKSQCCAVILNAHLINIIIVKTRRPDLFILLTFEVMVCVCVCKRQAVTYNVNAKQFADHKMKTIQKKSHLPFRTRNLDNSTKKLWDIYC